MVTVTILSRTAVTVVEGRIKEVRKEEGADDESLFNTLEELEVGTGLSRFCTKGVSDGKSISDESDKMLLEGSWG